MYIYTYQFKSLSTIIFVNSSSLLLNNTTNKATLSNKRQLSKINLKKKVYLLLQRRFQLILA